MNLKNLLVGVAVAGLLSTSYAMAEDYLGGIVKSTEIGGKEVLVGANGMTLYTWAKDTQGTATTPAATVCYDKCAVAWPVLWAPADTAVSGDWSLIDRTDATGPAAGMKQVVYKGWPLYYFVKDQKAGDMTGDNLNDWHVAVE